MKTKEDIRKLHGLTKENYAYPEYFSIFNIDAVMEMYAKEVAIDFGDWISNHRLDFQPAHGGTWIGLDMKTKTTEELFKIYKNGN